MFGNYSATPFDCSQGRHFDYDGSIHRLRYSLLRMLLPFRSGRYT